MMHVCLHAGPNFSYPLYKDCHWAANTFHLSLGAILGAMCEPGQFEASCHAVVLCHRRCHCCCRLVPFVPFVPFARQELLQALALEQERLLRRADEEPEIAGVSAWCQLVPFDAICTFIHSTWGCSMQLRFNVLLGLTDVETRYVGYCQVFRRSVLLTPGAPSMEADAPRKLSLSHTKRTRSRRQVGRSLPREMLDHKYCLRGQWAKWYQMDTNGSKWNKWNTGSTKCRHSVDVSTRLWCQVRLRSLPSCSTCGRATNQSCLRTSILCRFVWTAWTAWTRRNLAPERLLNSFQHFFIQQTSWNQGLRFSSAYELDNISGQVRKKKSARCCLSRSLVHRAGVHLRNRWQSCEASWATTPIIGFAARYSHGSTMLQGLLSLRELHRSS